MAEGKSRSGGAPQRRKIALALQGGGSHGAFTWGILDRLLEDPTLEVIGITGTSAGAMNTAVLADGLLRGGLEGGRKRLREFWEAIGRMPGFGLALWPFSGEFQSHVHLEQTPAYLAWDTLARNLSPYELNPGNFNPLRAPLEELVDFERIRSQTDVRVMVCATNALTSRRRTFTNKTITVDAVLASACLPQMFPAVEIDGEPYWDGGFTGNPAIFGLLPFLPACDLIIVRIDPIIRVDRPRSVREIHDRVTEVSFNSTFWMELQAMAILLKLTEQGHLDRERFGRFRFHAVQASEHLEKIPASSKLNNSPAFLNYLFEMGRTTADGWVSKHHAELGVRSSIDLTKLLPADIIEEATEAQAAAAS